MSSIQRHPIPSERQLLEIEPQLRSWVGRRIFSPEDIDDLVHECICRIIESYSRFRGASSFRTWAFGICRFVYLEFCRGELRRPIALAGEPVDDAHCERSEDALAVQMAVDTLPPRLRTVCDLYYGDDMSVREIAQLVHRPAGTIKYQLFEIRSLLRAQLGVSVRRSL